MEQKDLAESGRELSSKHKPIASKKKLIKRYQASFVLKTFQNILTKYKIVRLIIESTGYTKFNQLNKPIIA